MAYFDSIALEKGMYGPNGQGFTKSLEALDPSAGYRGTELAGLDAYERQLKRFGIKVNGASSDCVEKFFQTSQSSALFPEYVRRSVAQGAQGANILPDLIAANTKVDSLDYRPLASIPTEDDRSLKKVAEGAFIPATEIRLQENLIKLHKRGRMLVSSYEAIKFERLDLFTVTLRQIGAYIAKSQLADAVRVLLEGDGNGNPAQETSVVTPGTITYADLIELWSSFGDYEMNRIVASPGAVKQLLAVEELKNPLTGLNFPGTGKLSTPLGATLYRAACVPEGKLVALDKNCALEMVTAAEVAIETDKLIDRQLERAAITSIAGFAKIFREASRALTI